MVDVKYSRKFKVIEELKETLSLFFSLLFQFVLSKLPFNLQPFLLLSVCWFRSAAEPNRLPTVTRRSEAAARRSSPGETQEGRRDRKPILIYSFSLALSLALFLLRLLEISMINAEVKEGEILPPTIQKLMKGYNKYLRPFFESKETAATCSTRNNTALRGNVCLTEKARGSHNNLVPERPI